MTMTTITTMTMTMTMNDNEDVLDRAAFSRYRAVLGLEDIGNAATPGQGRLVQRTATAYSDSVDIERNNTNLVRAERYSQSGLACLPHGTPSRPESQLQLLTP